MCNIRNPPSLKAVLERCGRPPLLSWQTASRWFAPPIVEQSPTTIPLTPPSGLCSCCHPSQTNAVNHLLTDISDCQLAAPTTPNRPRSRRWGTGLHPSCPQTREQNISSQMTDVHWPLCPCKKQFQPSSFLKHVESFFQCFLRDFASSPKSEQQQTKEQHVQQVTHRSECCSCPLMMAWRDTFRAPLKTPRRQKRN